ncbi:hypothetical protein HDU98_009442 [Podochytrium sp. JEL0797]|nr:hypothetical protein HDU98_009442 [Podochytrium sp. JEL0797]
MQNLPTEIKCAVVQWFDLLDAITCAQLSKEFQAIVLSSPVAESILIRTGSLLNNERIVLRQLPVRTLLGKLHRVVIGMVDLATPLHPEWDKIESGWVLFANCGLTGPFPVKILRAMSAATVKRVDLSHNQLTGPVPAAELVRFQPDLNGLLLSNNQLTGTLPIALNRLTELKSLDLSHNQLTGPISIDLSARLAGICYLDLRHN